MATAARAGLKYIFKLSQFAADEASPVRFLRYHAAVERAIIDPGMTYTFIRPNLFMQGLLGFSQSIKAEGRFFAAAGDANISVVDVRDNAAVAAAALTRLGHEGRTYTLTGPAALTHVEMASGLSEAIGHPIAFVDVPPEAMRDALLGMGMPPWQPDGLVEDYAHHRRGEAASVASGGAGHDRSGAQALCRLCTRLRIRLPALIGVMIPCVIVGFVIACGWIASSSPGGSSVATRTATRRQPRGSS